MRLIRALVALTIIGGLILATGLVPSRVLAVDAVVSGANCNWDGLVAAINVAKSTTDDGGTVTFDCAEPNTTIEFTSEIVIDANVTIDGRNGDGPRITLDGVASDNIDTRIFNVTSQDANLTIENMTLQHASMTTDLENWQLIEWGGAIYNAGHLNISRVSFIDNIADRGGAIANGTNLSSSPVSGSLTITEGSFVDNTAQQIGGAIFTAMAMTIAQSSFVGNAGSDGGAIFKGEGDYEHPFQVTITSSTFSGNTASQSAFDIRVDRVWQGGSVSISWSTFVQPDDADWPSLMVNAVMGVTLTGLIFDGGGSGHCAYPNYMPSISYLLSNDSSCDRDTTTDQDWENVDPLLGDLTPQVVNGVTQYFYPLAGNSPAINVGGTTCESPDQLGTSRPVGSQCDIGAFEFPGYPPEITTINAPTSASEGEDVTVSVTATDPEGDTLHYWIDCENGGAWELEDSTSTSTTCNYQDDGSFTIKVQVSDGATTTADTKDISVSNVDPVITTFTVSPDPVQLNQTITLSVEASDVAGDLPLTETFSCDGVVVAGNTCSFTTGGSHSVGVTVADGDGGADSATKHFNVNTPPTNITTTISNPPLEGPGGTTITVTAVDADGDTLHYWIDCENDGTWELEDSTDNSFACSYPDEGSYFFAIQVSDGSASPIKRTGVFGVINAAPAITSFTAIPNAALIGENVVLSATWDDVAADVPNVTVTYDCGDGTQLAADTCSFSSSGSHTVSVTVDDHEGGVATQSLDVLVIEPISLCANRWTGQLREANGSGCGSSETLIELPQDAPLQLCVNKWNGAAKASSSCGRSEYPVMIYGTNEASVCINNWNGVIRVSDQCSRSEHQEWL